MPTSTSSQTLSDGIPAKAEVMDSAQLAEAFALFSRASEELSSAYNALQGQVAQLTERLTVLMEALPAGVVVLDRAGLIVQVNRAVQQLFQRDMLGLRWPAVAAELQLTETPGEMELNTGETTRRLSVSETALESGEEKIVLFQDITDTHRMRMAAERNERLAAMGEMVAGLAHQLRTPLAAALLYTSNLSQLELSGAARASVAARAVERLRYLERLIRDMLLFARGDSIGRQYFGVCDLATELTHTLEPLVRSRKIGFLCNCRCGNMQLYGDRKAIGGALTNLLDNAIQATEAGGTVSLEVDCSQDNPDYSGGLVCFSVRDTGQGIAAEVQKRLFDPFFTTRAEGTGLGLAIARGVARGHGGDIVLESTPGKGATFIFQIPVATGDVSAGDKAES